MSVCSEMHVGIITMTIKTLL